MIDQPFMQENKLKLLLTHFFFNGSARTAEVNSLLGVISEEEKTIPKSSNSFSVVISNL